MFLTCHYSRHEESIISLSHTLIQVFTMVIELFDAFVAGAKVNFIILAPKNSLISLPAMLSSVRTG